MRIHRAAVVGVAALALSLTACSSSSTTDVNKAYCDANAVAQSEVAKLKSLVESGNATVADVQKQVGKVKEAAEKANKEAGKLQDSVQKDIKSADESFSKAVDAIPGDATLNEASTKYQQAVADWEQSVTQIRADVGC